VPELSSHERGQLKRKAHRAVLAAVRGMGGEGQPGHNSGLAASRTPRDALSGVLRSPEWRQTRAAALVRASYCRALDPNHTEDLEVHHRTYERRGAELASDLIVLCRPCHRLHHKANGRPGPHR
jgi:5-methylcytosine-specific restriction endonuclease McrA